MGGGRKRKKGSRKRLALKSSPYGGLSWPANRERFDFNAAPHTTNFKQDVPASPQQPLLDINNRLRVLCQSDFRQYIRTYNRVVYPYPKHECYLYFSGQEFFFVKISVVDKTVERSVVYTTKQLAITYMTCKKVVWVEFTEEWNGIQKV